MNEPTILVKKTDGTTVRMTLTEFRAYQNKIRNPKSEIRNDGGLKSETPKQHQPHHIKHSAHQQAHHASVHHVKKTEAPQPKAWAEADHASLLEEVDLKALPVVSGTSALMTTNPAAKTSVGGQGPAGIFLQTIGWQGNEEDRKRLMALIESRVKDVRSDDQFLAYAMTPTHRGGAGLTPDMAEKLLKAIQSGSSQPVMKVAPPALKPVALPPRMPAKGPMAVPAASPLMAPLAMKRPMVSDITPPPAKKSVGPAEEFAGFNLTDLYRLAPTVPTATAKLKEKFDVWKNESFLMFLDVRDAWYQSPLYTDYITALTTAVRTRKKLSDVVSPPAQKNALTMEVVGAIVEVNRYISL